MDKGHTVNVGNCAMKSKIERGKHHTSSYFPNAHARAVQVLRNTMSCLCTLHMDMAARVIQQKIRIDARVKVHAWLWLHGARLLANEQ